MRQLVVSGIPSPNSEAVNELIERFQMPEISNPQKKNEADKIGKLPHIIFLFKYKNINFLVIFI